MEISWQHILSVYEWDLGMNRDTIGLRKLHKLADEYIYLGSRFRMRVNHAAGLVYCKCYSFLCSQAIGISPMCENNKSKEKLGILFSADMLQD